MPTVVLVGTLDTKGAEYGYVRDHLRAAGCEVILVDAGVLGEPLITPDISRAEVARAAGTTIDALVAQADRGAAIETMARGATQIVRTLFQQGKLHGILGLGGSG
ncbi:MAG: Tm-1-like ATP-binding domain-containing protein, partial [Thermorudis peleae]|nr:Tm-1-like ATP-binding domain-containing protein [Thermorudis peleae]